MAESGHLLASESSFYGFYERMHSAIPVAGPGCTRTFEKPQAWVGYGNRTVWSWDITFLLALLREEFYRSIW